jgi:hypothetical protein
MHGHLNMKYLPIMSILSTIHKSYQQSIHQSTYLPPIHLFISLSTLFTIIYHLPIIYQSIIHLSTHPSIHPHINLHFHAQFSFFPYFLPTSLLKQPLINLNEVFISGCGESLFPPDVSTSDKPATHNKMASNRNALRSRTFLCN